MQCQIYWLQKTTAILKVAHKYRYFEYKRVAFKTYNNCSSFAFNTSNTILFVGQRNGGIKVLGFNNQIKLLQTVVLSFGFVKCLIWRKKSNTLIIGHFQKNIIILEYDQFNQLQPLQILKIESKSLTCMTLSNDENLMVSGSFDHNIQFWKKEIENWICLQALEISFAAQCLSFNLQNKLIVSGGGLKHYIAVIEQQKNQNWTITQTISVGTNLPGTICFINDDKFAYHSFLEDHLEIYDYNQKNNQIFKIQKVQLQKSQKCFIQFPSQFSKERNILMVKHGKYVNYFSKDKKGDFYLQQSIEFGSSEIYGKLADDGRYSVTWDKTQQYKESHKGSYQIQLRKLICLNDQL